MNSDDIHSGAESARAVSPEEAFRQAFSYAAVTQEPYDVEAGLERLRQRMSQQSPADVNDHRWFLRCAIIACDVASIDDRSRDPAIQQQMHTKLVELTAPLQHSRLLRGVSYQDRKDGAVLWAPLEPPPGAAPRTPSWESSMLPVRFRTLTERLRWQRFISGSSTMPWLRLRIAFHVGNVVMGGPEPGGAEIRYAFGLLKATQLNEALVATGSDLVVITSQAAYEASQLTHLIPGSAGSMLNEVKIRDNVKGKETTGQAWLRVPGVSAADLQKAMTKSTDLRPRRTGT